MISLFQSSSTCWAWVVNDYGAILSTIFALATFAGLFFFCYLLQRTLARPHKQSHVSKHHHSQSQLDRTKRRKKKGLRGGGRGGRSRAHQQHQSKGHAASHTVEHLSVSPASAEAEEHDRKATSTPTNRTSLPAVLEDKPVEESSTIDGNRSCASPVHENPNNGDLSNDNGPTPASMIEASSSTDVPRLRVESVSSVDTSATTPLCFACQSGNDHQPCACGSGSSTPVGRSTPVKSVDKSTGATAAARVVSPATPSSSPSVQAGSSKKSNFSSHASSSRKQSNRRGGKKHANVLDGKPKAPPSSPVTPSRWDALKPTTAASSSTTTTTTRRNHHSNVHAGGKGRHQNDTTPNRAVRHHSSVDGRTSTNHQQYRGGSSSFSTGNKPEQSLSSASAKKRSIADATADLQRVLPSASVSFDSAGDIGLLMRDSAGSNFNGNIPGDGPSLVSGLPLTSFPPARNEPPMQSSSLFSTPTKSKSDSGFFATPPRDMLDGTPLNDSCMDDAAVSTPKTTALRAPPGLTPVAPPGLPPVASQSQSHSPMVNRLATKTPASTPVHPSSSMFLEPPSNTAAPVYDLFSGGTASESSDYTPQYRPASSSSSDVAGGLGNLLPPPSLPGTDIDSGGAAAGSGSPLFRPVSMVKENPFEVDGAAGVVAGTDAGGAGGRKVVEEDDDQQIEAELKELGGQMVGSILDF